jgi:opacity protein-like surface antigen
MKAIALGAFGAALLASAASAAPLAATTVGSAEVFNVDQVGLVCNEYDGRCWRIQGPRYVLRYFYDPSYFPGRGYNYYAGPGYYDRGYAGPRFIIRGW